MSRIAVLSVAVFLLLVPAARADSNDPRDVGNQNKIIKVLESPQLAPGDSGTFTFNFTNPHAFRMQNILLNVSIYQYATIEESLPVDMNWRWAYPRIRESTGANPREYLIHPGGPMDYLGNTSSTNYIRESFTILTSRDMPHGTVFAQSAYFLRFWLRFDFDNGTETGRMVLASRGYFSDAQWFNATHNLGNACSPYNATYRCAGNVNLTRLGVDGLLPDSAFGVKEPIPIWPFYGLVALTVFFLLLAFLFWVEENPGRYPRIERVWLTFKGRLRRVFRIPWAKKI